MKGVEQVQCHVGHKKTERYWLDIVHLTLMHNMSRCFDQGKVSPTLKSPMLKDLWTLGPVVLLGDYHAHMENDEDTWRGVIRKNGPLGLNPMVNCY